MGSIDKAAVVRFVSIACDVSTSSCLCSQAFRSLASTVYMVPDLCATLDSVGYSTRLVHDQEVDTHMLYSHDGRSNNKVVLNDTKSILLGDCSLESCKKETNLEIRF